MSMILKPSISRMRMIVVVTGRSAGNGDVAERLPAARAVDEGRLAHLLVQALERRQQDDEDERRPLPRVADDHRGPRQPGIGHPGEVAQPERHPERLEGSLGGVGQHQEHVADADRGDRQRDEEHDPEEAPTRDVLDRQQREAETQACTAGAIPTKTKISVTISEPGRPPSLTSAWTSSQTKPTSRTPADQAQHQARTVRASAPHRARPGVAGQDDRPDDDRPARAATATSGPRGSGCARGRTSSCW